MDNLTSLPFFLFDLQEAFLYIYSWESLLDLKNEKYMVSYLGRAQLFLPLAIVFILEYLSSGHKLWLLSLGPI